MRDWANKNPAIAGVIAAVVLVGAIGLAMSRSGAGRNRVPQTRFLYNLDTGDMAPGDVSRVATESNLAVAHVFSCSSCADESSRFIGFLERPNPNADETAGEDPRLVRTVEAESFAPMSSPAGEAAANVSNMKCNNLPHSECYPK